MAQKLEGKNLVSPKIKPHMWLDLGSGNPQEGENQPEGYVLQDVEPHPNIDIVCDVREISKYVPEGYCQKVRMSHLLEHFTIAEGKKLLQDIYRLLEPNGELIIIVPNFKWHAQLVLEGRDEEAIHYAFGGQKDEFDFHKTAFTPRVLKERLEECGFSVISLLDRSSIECVGLRLG